jgi:hypothetical protein
MTDAGLSITSGCPASPSPISATVLRKSRWRGGLGRAHQLFGAQLPTLLDELNHQLVA